MSKRKQRIDSATAAVKVMQGATREIAPPAHVRMSEEDWPFWHSVIAEFARSEWTDNQLEMAAMLARAMADLEREQYELRAEGSVMTSERGTPVVNRSEEHTSELQSLLRTSYAVSCLKQTNKTIHINTHLSRIIMFKSTHP